MAPEDEMKRTGTNHFIQQQGLLKLSGTRPDIVHWRYRECFTHLILECLPGNPHMSRQLENLSGLR